MKKVISLLLVLAIGAMALTACGGGESASGSDSGSGSTAAEFDTSKDITVVSREDGSGTRSAFIELTGVEVEDGDTTVDMTTENAETVNSTNLVMQSVAGNPYAIGYISLGSLNDSVKAVTVDGVEATVENIKAGNYALSRPFLMVTGKNPDAATQDFINFCMSAEGQKVVEDEKYIPTVDNAESYTASDATGNVLISGSSSVSPVMEKLIEAYEKVNTNVTVELNTSDSSTGIKDAISGNAQIGIASRELKDTEAPDLIETKLAIDGIAVVVNNANTITALTTDGIRAIYTGETTKWSDAK